MASRQRDQLGAAGSWPNDIWRAVDALFSDADAERTESAVGQWTPPVDILEDSERFVVRMDVPGVAPEAINVEVHEGALTIHGERSTEAADTDERRATRREAPRGRFYRRFLLPDSADAEHIEAKRRNGVLEISIAKRAAARARRVKVE